MNLEVHIVQPQRANERAALDLHAASPEAVVDYLARATLRTLHPLVLAWYHEKTQNYPDALRVARQIVLDPSDTPEWAEAYRIWGTVLQDEATSSAGLEQAIRYYKRAAVLSGNHYAPVLVSLGNAYFAEGRYQDAMKQYEQAIRISRMEETAHYDYGLCLVMSKRPKDALDEFREATHLVRRQVFFRSDDDYFSRFFEIT